MTRPHVVLVDDSETFLALERAALEDHYVITTASDGAEGLARLRQLRPAIALVDLAMPNMAGDEMLRAAKADPSIRDIPIVIVSSQQHRADEMRGLGAADFVVKPVRAPDLLATVARVLTRAAGDDEGPGAILSIEVCGASLAIPLRAVTVVLDELATLPLLAGPSYLREMFVLRGEPVVVLDLARRLRRPPTVAKIARKLVVLAAHEERTIALRVDRVNDPDEISPTRWRPATRVGGLAHPELRAVCRGIFLSERGPMVVLRPEALVQSAVLRRLGALVTESIAAATGALDDTVGA